MCSFGRYCCSSILDEFCGRIRLCAVPAEDLLEIEYRSQLKKEGKIKYYGGKPEFLSRGYFDGVDIAFIVHTSYRKVKADFFDYFFEFVMQRFC